jgi:hypothetical protein
MFSHQEIFCKENLAQVMIKICHLCTNQMMLLVLEDKLYLDHNFAVIGGES